jgi:hypothetical protein
VSPASPLTFGSPSGAIVTARSIAPTWAPLSTSANVVKPAVSSVTGSAAMSIVILPSPAGRIAAPIPSSWRQTEPGARPTSENASWSAC